MANPRRHASRSPCQALFSCPILRSHARGKTVEHLQPAGSNVRSSSLHTTTCLESLPKHPVWCLQRPNWRKLLLERPICETAATLRRRLPVYASATICTVRSACTSATTVTRSIPRPIPTSATTLATIPEPVPTLSAARVTRAPPPSHEPAIPTPAILPPASTAINSIRRRERKFLLRRQRSANITTTHADPATATTTTTQPTVPPARAAAELSGTAATSSTSASTSSAPAATLAATDATTSATAAQPDVASCAVCDGWVWA
jgi:hypothetical protein